MHAVIKRIPGISEIKDSSIVEYGQPFLTVTHMMYDHEPIIEESNIYNKYFDQFVLKSNDTVAIIDRRAKPIYNGSPVP
jgi:hypothetical protein